MMYDRIYRVYRSINLLLTLFMDVWWRKRCVKQAREIISDGGRILDCGCGTGDLTVYIEKEFPRAVVYAVDANENMLSVAKRTVKRAVILKAFCNNLPFDDEFFDCVFISFALRNFFYSNDSEKIFMEIARVLKKGGRLVILETSVCENVVMRFFLKVYLTLVFSIAYFFVDSKQKSAYDYLKKTILMFRMDDFIDKNRHLFDFKCIKLFPYVIKVCIGVKF